MEVLTHSALAILVFAGDLAFGGQGIPTAHIGQHFLALFHEFFLALRFAGLARTATRTTAIGGAVYAIAAIALLTHIALAVLVFAGDRAFGGQGLPAAHIGQQFFALGHEFFLALFGAAAIATCVHAAGAAHVGPTFATAAFEVLAHLAFAEFILASHLSGSQGGGCAERQCCDKSKKDNYMTLVSHRIPLVFRKMILVKNGPLLQ
jgi:hypothetical protein